MSVQEATQAEQQQVEAQADTSQATDQVAATGAADSQETQQTDAQAGDQAERDEKGRFKGVQPRIDELTRKRHEAEREAAYWRGVATQGKAQPSAEQAAPAKPTPDQFDDYGAYVEALADWKAEEKITKALSERETKAAEKQQVETRTASWLERQTAARAAMPDYDAVVGGSDTPIAPHVAEAILESEHGPALAYHFAKNPDALERLNGLSPRQADREIGRIEERLTSNAADGQAATAAAPVKTSNTPKPASVSSAQGRSTTPNLQTASMDEYMRQRKAQGARWAR